MKLQIDETTQTWPKTALVHKTILKHNISIKIQIFGIVDRLFTISTIKLYGSFIAQYLLRGFWTNFNIEKTSHKKTNFHLRLYSRNGAIYKTHMN